MTKARSSDGAGAPSGSQTLLRGLDLLEAVSRESMALPDLSRVLGLNRSTAHRLASALVDRGYLRFIPRTGYMLGPKLLEMGFAARQQIDLPRIARPHLEALSDATEDTVHLGVLDRDKALYLDKIPGRRRIEIGSRVGERHPLCSTGLGKSLILDCSEAEQRAFFEGQSWGALKPDFETWRAAMRDYAAGGYSLDLEENEDRIRCVGAPIRNETGAIVASISLSSVAQYMSDARMRELVHRVRDTAAAISRDIGWPGD
ncbi:MAG: transcriptional regulator [Sphingomonas sanxanigenens]|uniref:Transcriptional regulator n=1 Tax=Sphingomonas sanxanigenens TaxID=397260 RepID=A0A2W5A3D6_9SPHN|nr:MAG: transcriptional regulator [Sphingomonas sanxanigenens]